METTNKLPFSIETFTIVVGHKDSGIHYKKSQIYANGQHQLPITVTLKLNEKLTSDDEENLKDAIYLCHYRTGKRLETTVKDKQYSYNNRIGQFCCMVPNFAADSTASFALDSTASFALDSTDKIVLLDQGEDEMNTTLEVELYLSTKDMTPEYIAAGLATDFGDINTSDKLTNIEMNNGDSWKEKDKIAIVPLEALDYSHAKHLRLINGGEREMKMWQSYNDFETKVEKIHIHKSGLFQPSREDGSSSWIGCRIIPSDPNLKFKNIKKLTKDTHSIPGVDVAGGGADIIWNVTGDNNYDASFIFVNKKEYGLEEGSEIRTKDHHYYTLKIEDDRHWWENKDLKDDEIRIDFCNYRIPEGSLRAHGWGDQPSEIGRAHV